MKERINKIVEYSKNINLLYVEDNAENRESTSNVLSIIFANIIIAVDGQDGLNKFKENKVLIFSGRYINEKTPQKYSVNQFFFNDLFGGCRRRWCRACRRSISR